jgi:hypothetical protein
MKLKEMDIQAKLAVAEIEKPVLGGCVFVC